MAAEASQRQQYVFLSPSTAGVQSLPANTRDQAEGWPCREVAEEELDEFDPIDKLQQLGVNAGEPFCCPAAALCVCPRFRRSCTSSNLRAGDIKKAKEAGYHTCQSLLMQTKKARLGCLDTVSLAKHGPIGFGDSMTKSCAGAAEAVRHQGPLRSQDREIGGSRQEALPAALWLAECSRGRGTGKPQRPACTPLFLAHACNHRLLITLTTWETVP